MALISGTKLGPYEIGTPLGAGGMGEVYRARDTRLDREVAIKVLPSHLSENPEFRARFEREAKTISGLQHPNICVLYDAGCQRERQEMPPFRWEDIDHSLVSLRLTNLAEEMHSQIKADEARIGFENCGNLNRNTTGAEAIFT
jgi:serine/threonine protein kinase